MRTLFCGALVFKNGRLTALDILVEDGIVSSIGYGLPQNGCDVVFDLSNKIISPGFADVHVHLREPGFSYKETIAAGTAAAAAGGYTALCSMPNLSPPPDSSEALTAQEEIIRDTALVPVLPYGCITVGQKGGELVDFSALAPRVAGFSDDGRGVQSADVMKSAMLAVKEANSLIAAHCEDESLLFGGYIHDGAYARANGHRGISSKSEWGQLERDLELVRQTRCPYHMCHLSTKESAGFIRAAKAEGLPVSCETAPHYLLLCDEDIQEDGRFKMNPPLRSREDRDAVLKAVLDGTIDMVATDHAPHSAEEKAGGLKASAMGVTGLETAFPMLYTYLVQTGKMSLETLLSRMALAPRRVFPALPGGEIEEGRPLDICVIDPDFENVVRPESFFSKGRASPFEGRRTKGKIIMTIAGGKTVWHLS